MAAALIIGTIGDKVDLLIKQGSTFGPYWVQIQDETGAIVDLTGASVKASLRKAIGDASPSAVFEINYSPVEGKFSYGLTSTQTTGLVAGATVKDPAGKYFWDSEITWPSGKVDPVTYGDVTVFREITRE